MLQIVFAAVVFALFLAAALEEIRARRDDPLAGGTPERPD